MYLYTKRPKVSNFSTNWSSVIGLLEAMLTPDQIHDGGTAEIPGFELR
jgi:hypothetical protein